jgi:hypothetical protein
MAIIMSTLKRKFRCFEEWVNNIGDFGSHDKLEDKEKPNKELEKERASPTTHILPNLCSKCLLKWIPMPMKVRLMLLTESWVATIRSLL